MIKKALIVAAAVTGLGLLGTPAFATPGAASDRDVLDTTLVGPVTIVALSDNPWTHGDGNVNGTGNIGGNGNNVGNNNGGNGNSNGGDGNNVGAGNTGGNGNNGPSRHRGLLLG